MDGIMVDYGSRFTDIADSQMIFTISVKEQWYFPELELTENNFVDC